ncbi:PREDICTED: protein SCAR2-like isoform X2 [Lupinus angustifolius]|uniref:protein SCAR2-like isoform X2 n=1 Tax=Lupinus angustifolius TaxID=3871 RepID=UPI00092EAC61|nr:PREDICTED: protein SCAR2-like isoform X2 [Lupinus angustifolius]
MPISRYHIRSEFTLSDPELYRRPEYDVPESLLQGVSMAALVGFLRQLGDLSQFAAEIFHDLHEEVIATTQRGHSLMTRVQQLEAEVPAIEKAFLSQTHHSSFFTNAGIDWHANFRSEQNLVTRGELPRFIMDSYEECRGPPRLFLLDKFDVAGPGACLKRYTDPSFFKVDSDSSETATLEVHREDKFHKVKKKGAQPRNSETPEKVPSPAKLYQLFLEERIENAHSDPPQLVKLKKTQLNESEVEVKSETSYMEQILEIPSPPDQKIVGETSTTPLPVKMISDDTSETGVKILEISNIAPVRRSLRNESALPQSWSRQGLWHSSSPNMHESELKPYLDMDSWSNADLVKVHQQVSAEVTNEISSRHPMVVDEQKEMEYIFNGYHSDDVTSEVEYMDALATIESDLESDDDCIPKKSLLKIQQVTTSEGKEEDQMRTRFSDSRSFGDSSTSDEISSFRNDRNGIHTQLQAQFSDFQSIGNYMPFDQLPQTVKEFIKCDDAHVQGQAISNYRQVSSGLSVMDSGHLLLSPDLGPFSPMSLPAETQSGEISSDPIELHLRLEDEEDRKRLAESVGAIPDPYAAGSFDDNSWNNLDMCVPYVYSNALSQVSDDLNLTDEDKCSDHSEMKVLQEESPNEYSSEILASGDIGSQGEGGIKANELKSEDLSLVMEAPPSSSFTEELCCDFTLKNPPDDPDSEEIEVLHSDPQSKYEEVLRMIHSHGRSGSICSVDQVKDDDHIEHPSSPDYTSQDNHDMVNDMFTQKVQSEAHPSVGDDKTDTSSRSRNLANLHEPFPGSSDSLVMDVNEAAARESLTELEAQEVVDQPQTASADVQSNFSTSVPCNSSDYEIYSNIQDSYLKDKIKYDSYINDMKMLPICSIGENKENYTSDKFQPQQMQISNQLERERISHSASEFTPETHCDEPSSCVSSSKSSDLEINQTKHGMDPSKPFLPGLFPKATKTNIEEMPPLPPLPPKQWRMGKSQHPSLVSQREEIEASQAAFQPMRPVKPDDKSQIRLSTSERETLLYQNPFFSIIDVENNEHKHSPGFSTGVLEHPVPVAIPFKFPIMVNEADGQHDYLALERSQIQNPSLTIPVVSTGWLPHEFVIASEREMVQNSNPFPPIPPAECAASRANPISPQEKATQSPSYSKDETILQVINNRPEHAESAASGGDPISPQENPSQSPSQSMDETSLEVERDILRDSHLVQPAEFAVSGDNLVSSNQKLTQSPTLFMKVTSLKVETHQQCSIDLEKEQEDPSISSVSPPCIEIVQPNHSLLPSGVEMALSLEKPAQTPTLDSEMENGKNKPPPPPRNPLLDAFDRSKLRKVTDRIRPQLAPKIDERDSLLEQIRTKSFNLKPAVATSTRRSIQGPRTNLTVAAMLEKANAIRQAFAGSDEDDDADSWSDC